MDFLIDQVPWLPSAWKPTLKDTAMGLVSWGDWFCGLRAPSEIFEVHTSFFFNEFLFLLCGLITLVHAWRHGTRYWYTWIGILLHGVNTEMLTYLVPDFENFWHGQTSMMFAGRRLPIHIVILYPMFDYTANIAAKKLRLPWWAEGCAVGLATVLIDLPYDIMGVKLLWWTWHDTDPNVADRMYHVPWTSYYFHAAFACSFNLLLNGTRKLLLPAEYDWRLIGRELLCCLVAAGGAFWLGALQFVPVYHLLHDIFHVHTEVPALMFLSVYALIVWNADRDAKQRRDSAIAKSIKTSASRKPWPLIGWLDELFLMLLIHYGFFATLVWLADPAGVVSTGLHEPIGRCGAQIPVQTVSGLVLSKRKFLCLAAYDEPYFNFHCTKPPKLPNQDSSVEWYTICGTPFENRAEYIAIISFLCAVGVWVFAKWMNSGPVPEIPERKIVKRKNE